MENPQSKLAEYVYGHTERGDCKCGKCCDTTGAPDPSGHTVDMVFFKVAAKDAPSVEDFKALTAAARDGSFSAVNPLDGLEHNYLELGAWIGDQGLAMLYMALGVNLGIFKLLSPAMLGLEGAEALQFASMGMLSVQLAK